MRAVILRAIYTLTMLLALGIVQSIPLLVLETSN